MSTNSPHDRLELTVCALQDARGAEDMRRILREFAQSEIGAQTNAAAQDIRRCQHLSSDLHEALCIIKRLAEIISATPKETYKDWALGAEAPFDLVRKAEQFLAQPRYVFSPSDEKRETPLNCDRDASRWAREFNDVLAKEYNLRVDEGWLLGWFANAIMCGEDTYRWRVEAAQSATGAIELLRKVLASHERLHASRTHGLPLSLKNEIAAAIAATDSGREK